MINDLLIFVVSREYAQVTEMLEDCRLNAICMDGKKQLCHICGALQHNV
jgi:translation initiation factor IF-1